MRLAATVVWLLAAALAVGFGIVDGGPEPAPVVVDSWHGQGLAYCPLERHCS